ncbi:MAG: hypothetical protein LBP22_13070 [Deltaproteobacteria bacterium]|nr:hypothetical protein [Deltaproteobacteria bacterium]
MKSCARFPVKALYVWIFLGLGLSACQSHRLPVSVSEPQSQGRDFEFIERLYVLSREIPAVAVRGSARYTEINGAGHHFTFEAYVQNPDLLALYIFGPGGSPVMRLTLRDQTAEIIDYGRKIVAAGLRSALSDVSLPIPLPPEELASILSGSLSSAPERVQLTGLWTEPARSEFTVWLKRSGEPVRLYLDGAPQEDKLPVLRRLTAETVRGPLTVAYDRLTELTRRDREETVLFPHSVICEIGRSRQKQRLEISYEEAVLGLILPQENFAQSPPAGFTQQDL